MKKYKSPKEINFPAYYGWNEKEYKYRWIECRNSEQIVKFIIADIPVNEMALDLINAA